MTDATHASLDTFPRIRTYMPRRPAGTGGQSVGRIFRKLARAIGATRKRGHTLADLTDRQRADIGLSGRSIAAEPGLGAINQIRGYPLSAQLGAPFGR